MFARLSDWLEQRVGFRRWIRGACDEPVRGGSRWAYVFGSALVVAFVIQLVTGIALAAYYSPSTTDAWASVNFIQNHVYLGWLLRGVHHWGASAMVVLIVLHLLQTLWFGAFRSPREINWLSGFVMFQLVLGFALTGYLLPWDQKGYWATQVATSIAGTIPAIGGKLQQLLQGGPEYGNLTLTRFYALHVMVLPAGLVLFLVFHIYLFRRHGVTPPSRLTARELETKTEPFFPTQLLKDTAFSLFVLVIVVLLAWRDHGASLEAPADPASQFLARPEWYFLPLFQLLKYFEGKYEIVGTVILPTIAMSFLAFLPFLHSWLQRRSPRASTALATLVTLGLTGVVGLGALAVWQDSRNAAFAEMGRRAEKEAKVAGTLASVGVPVTGPLDLYRNDPLQWGVRVYGKGCNTCHHDCGQKPYKGAPCLDGYASRAWLAQFMRDPHAPFFFGNTKIDEMDAWSGTDTDLGALVEFLYGEGGHPDTNPTLASKGAALFESEGCGSCHELSGKGNGQAPDLKGYGSQAWLIAFIRQPNSHRFFDVKNEMEIFDCNKLDEGELNAVVAYIRSQALRDVKLQ